MNAQETVNIKQISSWDSGGGIVVDIIELNDGRVLGVTEDAVILYANMDDLLQGDASVKRPCIYL